MQNYLSVTEAADFLDLSVGRIRQLLRSESESRLMGEKCGNQWVIAISELERFKALERPPGNPNLRTAEKIC